MVRLATFRSVPIYSLVLILLAQVRAPLQAAPATVQVAPSEHVAVLLIIDSSGSMAESDPSGLRYTAAKLFLALLDDGDVAGLINFSTTSRVLAPMTVIEGDTTRRDLIGKLDGIADDGYTDIRAAFQDAVATIGTVPTEMQRYVVFLTDGAPEVPEGLPAGYEDETLDLVRQTGVPILAIGLTQGGQSPFLGRVKQTGVEGSSILPANTAADVLDAYLGILSTLKDRTVVQPEDGGTSITLDPALAPYIDRASFVAALPEPGTVTFSDPTGSAASAQFGDNRFNVATVLQPLSGRWTVQLPAGGQARAILRSRLRVRVLQPGTYHPAGTPMPIVANLIAEEPGKAPTISIGDATFSALIEGPGDRREALDQLLDDGTRGDIRAGDGAFSGTYVNTDQPGTYAITLNGRKGAVEGDSIGTCRGDRLSTDHNYSPSVEHRDTRAADYNSQACRRRPSCARPG